MISRDKRRLEGCAIPRTHRVTPILWSLWVLLLLVPGGAPAQWTEGQEGHWVLRGGWLFDSVSDERRRNTGIVIRDGEIVEVDAALELPETGIPRVVDLDETDTILPGLFDLHAHYNLDLVDEGRVEEVVYNGIVFLANGVTVS